MRANRETQESDRFFQDRFRATRLVDEASLLACAAYVDLNLIRAAMAETLEQSKRPSDKGFLAMQLVDYLNLLDWTARQLVPGKRVKIGTRCGG
ncbi:hypothetical protein Q31b_56930 [Novipirellula aureliae]|uniref:Uncharacterized protein n=1 Tax=Novipirellula aureliae TaxID=2527966 RepID=A0A5C6DES9_9BACT|nr:hypothetical protein [Novipirellula aureliae]TWU33636.1 hypothetical protein Q31b_56930 [Novipirellula aureliae]